MDPLATPTTTRPTLPPINRPHRQSPGAQDDLARTAMVNAAVSAVRNASLDELVRSSPLDAVVTGSNGAAGLGAAAKLAATAPGAPTAAVSLLGDALPNQTPSIKPFGATSPLPPIPRIKRANSLGSARSGEGPNSTLMQPATPFMLPGTPMEGGASDNQPLQRQSQPHAAATVTIQHQSITTRSQPHHQLQRQKSGTPTKARMPEYGPHSSFYHGLSARALDRAGSGGLTSTDPSASPLQNNTPTHSAPGGARAAGRSAPGSPLVVSGLRADLMGMVARFASTASAASATAASSSGASFIDGSPSTPGTLRLRVHVVTYNMASTAPGEIPATLLSAFRGGADIYAIGTQESSGLSEWEAQMTGQLGPSYVKVAQESLLSICLLVYAHRKVEPLLSEIRTSAVPCGVGNVIGNKGGVAVSLLVAGVRVLLVTCHLAAHAPFVDRRNADYRRIVTGLFGQGAVAGGGSSLGGGGPIASTSTPTTSTPSITAEAAGSGVWPMGSGQDTDAAQASPETPDRNNETDSGRLGGGSGVPSSASDTDLTPPPPTLSPIITRPGGSESCSTPPHVLRLASVSSMTQMPPMAPGTPSPPSALLVPKGSTVLDVHDLVLWCGDLNYRVQGTPAAVVAALQGGMPEVLHANDQLRIQMRKGAVFQGFDEQAIHFPPTFKFKVHKGGSAAAEDGGSGLSAAGARGEGRSSQNGASSAQGSGVSHEGGTLGYSLNRTPSWTDRVLHALNPLSTGVDLRPLYYRSVSEMTSSDHRPVIAGYEVAIRPGGIHRAQLAPQHCTIQ